MKQVTVVFPIGGKAQRFGGKFKPFLKIFDKTFLELAIEPFLKHKDSIADMIFLTTKEQCHEFNVLNKINSFGLPFRTLVHGTATADGIIADINKLPDTFLDDVIFCDCDHSLNVDAIFEAIQEDKYDVIIPGWVINRNERKKWSVAAVNDWGTVFDIEEKDYPANTPHADYYGVIGCYYFKSFPKIDSDWKYISDAVGFRISTGHKVQLVKIHEAEFFGDPERLKKLYEEKKASTIFCDLDGTIIKHEGQPDFTQITLLDGALDKIEEWRCQNCFIVLTTSRDEQFRPEMESLLRKAGIRYEAMIMGLPPGTRHLINDKKPYSDITMAKAHEVTRDEGIKDVNLNQIGHSFAQYSAKGKVAYKVLSDNADEYQKIKFHCQYISMNRIFHTPELKHLVPPMYGFSGDSYGMEQLEGYQGLDKVQDKLPVLEKLFKELPKLYAGKLPVPGILWIENYLDEKIFAKKKQLEKLGLDAGEVFDILSTLTVEERKKLSPAFLVEKFHGDLTYENILCKGEDFKLIDFDNDDKSGAPEMDLGKLWQSAYAQYEHWDNAFQNPPEISECEAIVKFYHHLLLEPRDKVYKKALFYCALHLFRMIPYQYKSSKSRAEKALKLCKQYLNRIWER